MFDMFKKSTLTRWQGTKMEFSTLDPSISSRMDFVEILQQEKRRELSTVKAIGGVAGIDVQTKNVKAIRLGIGVLSLDLSLRRHVCSLHLSYALFYCCATSLIVFFFLF